MKNFPKKIRSVFLPFAAGVVTLSACNHFDTTIPLTNYDQVNLVSDEDDEEYEAQRIDETLVNPWGMAVNPNGPIWIASTGSGKSQVYDKNGAQLIPAVTIPGLGKNTGHPTGIVFNPTTDFVISSTGTPGRFIYVGVDGLITAWAGGTMGVIIKNFSENSAYTGLALASNQGSNYLYAANFRRGTVSVFDKNYKKIDMSFKDPDLPTGYKPFNIRYMNGLLYVTYAKVDPVTHESAEGVGLGLINIFTTDGVFVKRFTSFGHLNAPWGMAQAQNGFCNVLNAILVGNFGDGHINVFDALGNYKGQLMSKGKPIEIEGLWSLENKVPGADASRLYFTAGVDEEEHGLFGYIDKK